MAALCGVRIYLLRRDIERYCPQVDLPVCVDAGDDEEYPWPFCSTLSETTETEDDGTLVLLDNLEKGEKG